MSRSIALVAAFVAFLAGSVAAPASAQDTQFVVVSTGIQSPTLPFTDPGYSANGQFTVNVVNGNCIGTYTVYAAPLAGTGPSGSTPPPTPLTGYLTYPQGSFLFESAGAGTYRVTVIETGACNPPTDPTIVDVVVPDATATQYIATPIGIVSPTLPFTDPGYAANGQFTVNVVNGNCIGTYAVDAVPLAGTGPSGSTPPQTPVTGYNGFPQGSFLFGSAGAGTYRVTVTETGACNLPVDPVVLDVVVPDASATQHTATPTGIARPALPFLNPGYTPNGQFTIVVGNGACSGVYTLNAVPLAGTGPGGSTPPSTSTTTYIGFPAGSFLFANAGAGTYRVTVTETGPSCNPPVNPVIIDVVVPDATATAFTATPVVTPASIPFDQPAYSPNGSFVVTVTAGNCPGTYTVNASPVPNSAPDGSTPPFTPTTTYIGFPAGDFQFTNAGVGRYLVVVTETGPCTFPPGEDTLRLSAFVGPSGPVAPIPVNAPLALLLASLALAGAGWRALRRRG